MGLGSILSVAAPIVGSLLGNKQDNDAAQSNAREANAYTTEQLQNRHQWEVADLRKAGLNPVLSAHGTPSIGSSAKAETFSSSDAIDKGANSARQNSLLKAQLENVKADTAKKQAETMATDNSAAVTAQTFRINRAAEKAANIDEKIYGSPVGGIVRGVEKFGPPIGNVVNSARNTFMPPKKFILGNSRSNPGMRLKPF